MDLIVFADGIARNVSGITPETTCTQVVYALAHATNQKGRFNLISKLSNSNEEYRLSPNEQIMKYIKQFSNQDANFVFELRKLSNSPKKILDQSNDNYKKMHLKFPSTSVACNQSFCSESETETKEKEIVNEDNKNDIENWKNKICKKTNLNESLLHRERLYIMENNNFNIVEDTNNVSSQQQKSLNNSIDNFQMLKNDGKYRPPPPAYEQIIEQRCNLLTKNVFINKNFESEADKHFSWSFSTVLNLTINDLYQQKFTKEELDNLIDVQSQVITAQKNELLGLELTLSNDAERELVQLKKQHNNLRTVLNSLHNADWPTRLETEKQEAERLNTAINAMKTAIENKRRELYPVLELQQKLEYKCVLEENQQKLTNNFEKNVTNNSTTIHSS